MQRAVFTTEIAGGRMLQHRDDVHRLLASMEGRKARITIEEAKRPRSLSQNSYYWGVIIPGVVRVLRFYGNNVDAEAAHEFCKATFLPPGGISMLITPLGDCEHRSTAMLTTAAMEDYHSHIRAWAAGEGVQIPLPNESLENDYHA